DSPDAPACAATQKVALEQADGNFDLEKRTNQADANDPFAGPAKDEFSLCTEPWSANYRRDSLRAIKVSNISTPGPTMTAEIRYTEAWKDLYSLPAGDFGHFVAATGWDYNDDGVEDFLQGLPGVSRANLVSGKDGAVLRDYNGAGGLDRFGGAVAAGDITGDGVPDYAIGAFEGAGAGGPFSNIAGRAYVFDGATGMFLWVALGTSNGDRLGAAVGILEGMGVLVGAPGMGEGGRVILYGPSGSEMNHWDGEGQDDSFGATIAAMDFGNLGFAVGAPLYPGDFAMANSQRGKVYVYNDGGGLVGSVEGKHGAAQLGASIAYAGRIDRTGTARPYLIAGSPQAFGDGEAYLIDLQAPAIVATFEGESGKSRFGASVAGGTDVDGDMGPDLAV
ncbi:MAG: hypothetical protein K8I02_09710, partial [Candidatus Methylomirabilis sp.]|nr:hypothetical protein [Deltaproteobacteria bacterium]